MMLVICTAYDSQSVSCLCCSDLIDEQVWCEKRRDYPGNNHEAVSINFHDMHLSGAILFQKTVSNLSNLVCLCYSTDCNDFFPQMASTGIPVFLRFFNRDELLTGIDSVFMFSNLHAISWHLEADLQKYLLEKQILSALDGVSYN